MFHKLALLRSPHDLLKNVIKTQNFLTKINLENMG